VNHQKGIRASRKADSSGSLWLAVKIFSAPDFLAPCGGWLEISSFAAPRGNVIITPLHCHPCRLPEKAERDHGPRVNKQEQPMKRYVIERSLPGVGKMDGEELKGAAETSNAALAKLSGKAQWVQSFVADDKTFCVYLAENEDAVREHAKLSGFPATKITEVKSIIDPMTAAG
jgi:hypothetical protein